MAVSRISACLGPGASTLVVDADRLEFHACSRSNLASATRAADDIPRRGLDEVAGREGTLVGPLACGLAGSSAVAAGTPKWCPHDESNLPFGADLQGGAPPAQALEKPEKAISSCH